MIGPYLSGGISGIYAARASLKSGTSIEQAVAVGLVSAVCTTASINNVHGWVISPDIDLRILAANASADLTFGTGYNSIAAATYKGVTSNAVPKSNRAPVKRQIVNMVPVKRQIVNMVPVKRRRIIGHRYYLRNGVKRLYPIYAKY